MSRRGRKRARFKVKIRVETIHSLAALCMFALAALLAISFMGSGPVMHPLNEALRQLFGVTALVVPFVLLTAGLVLTGAKWSFAKPQVFLGSVLLLIGVSALAKQGELGLEFYNNIAMLIHPEGAWVLFGTIILGALLLATDTSLPELFRMFTSHLELDATEREKRQDKGLAKINIPGFGLPGGGVKINLPSSEAGKGDARTSPVTAGMEAGSKDADKKDNKFVPMVKLAEPLVSSSGTHHSLENDPLARQLWTPPPLSLLSQKAGGQADRGDIQVNAHKIEAALDSFGIQAKVQEINGGPAVTQYALRPFAGTKLSRITALSNDLALALAAPTGQIRIEAPIPGKDLVGIEVPNRSPSTVTLAEMLRSPEMQNHRSKLLVALGHNVAGQPVVADIARMPHMLIAGATGSGKSVAVNAFIASILFRASPKDVKFILVDPKRVELTGYNDIPHLLTPVIVEAEQVVSALKWATVEMDRRYKRFAEVGARNIDSFNEFSGFQAMPYLIIIIDELADLMLYAPADVEDCITRLAQMARATGIHLVLATQRPSVDVITGLIKANIPARISFSVSSMTDSRVIIDQPGAEKLLGRGDMLYVPPDQAKPTRIQGTFVSDKEIKALIDHIKKNNEQPEYQEEITTKFHSSKMGGGSSSGAAAGGDANDPLLRDAVQLFLDEGRASTSALQRRYRVGFGRGGRIIDTLFQMGIVGPSEGSKPRELNAEKAREFLGGGKTGENLGG